VPAVGIYILFFISSCGLSHFSACILRQLARAARKGGKGDKDGMIDQKKPVAKWWFIHPYSAAAADDWVRKHLEADKVGDGIARRRLSGTQLLRLQQAMPVGHVLLVEQYAGDTVVVPPGWMHMVQNEQMCLKLAFDTYVASSFPAYIASWLQVASKVTKAHNTADYMAVNDVLAYAFAGDMGV
jgi:hypothetical protein